VRQVFILATTEGNSKKPPARTQGNKNDQHNHSQDLATGYVDESGEQANRWPTRGLRLKIVRCIGRNRTPKTGPLVSSHGTIKSRLYMSAIIVRAKAPHTSQNEKEGLMDIGRYALGILRATVCDRDLTRMSNPMGRQFPSLVEDAGKRLSIWPGTPNCHGVLASQHAGQRMAFAPIT